MPSLLRPRLECFYCGSRSDRRQDGTIRRWECDKCEATNYLDEASNGCITDPPAFDTPAPINYAHPIDRSPSPAPVFSFSDEMIFCNTCIKNQHLLTQTLASYLPATTHSDYETFEAAYPHYRKSLEQRYPQICANCAPKAEDRIKAASYAAKTDHLRRMLDKTRNGGTESRDNSDWKRAGIMLSGWGWWSSILIQLVWHVFGVLAYPADIGLRPLDQMTVGGCIAQGLLSRQCSPECLSVSSAWVGTALFLGLATAWWNNKLESKLKYPRARLLGQSEHLALQLVMIAVRFLAWYTLQDPCGVRLTQEAFKAAHAFMLVFLAVSCVRSAQVVKLDKSPRWTFSSNHESLLPPSTQSQLLGHVHDLPASRPSSTPFGAKTPSYTQPFPIEKLASERTPRYAQSSTTGPLTPPPEDSDTETETNFDPENAMEWTPTPREHPFGRTGAVLNPIDWRSKHQQQPLAAQPAQPSPFRGRLPPAPIAPAHKLRNPPNPITFRKVPASEQRDFFRQMGITDPKDATASSSAVALHDEAPSSATSRSTRTSHRTLDDANADSDWVPGRGELKPSTWFLDSDNVATGLEDMLSSATLSNTPLAVRKAINQRRNPAGFGSSRAARFRRGGKRTANANTNADTTANEPAEGEAEVEAEREGEGEEHTWFTATNFLLLLAVPLVLSVVTVAVREGRDLVLRRLTGAQGVFDDLEWN